MKKIILATTLIFTFLLAGCPVPGISSDNNTSATAATYSYDLTENGCKTENQTFSSREAMCDGLRNDELNHYCAQSMRYERFKTDCSDRTW